MSFVFVLMKFVGSELELLIGCLWLSGISGSIAYNWSKPAMKTSVRIIHARYVF